MTHSPEANAKRSASLQGNQCALKLNTVELRQEAYRQYCAHLASGLNKFSFYFEHPELTLTTDTMEKYLKEYASEFDPRLMKVALAKRFKFWEQEGMKLMQGKYKAGSPVVWQTFMRNSFRNEGWDRELTTHTMNPDMVLHMERLRAEIAVYKDKPKEIEVTPIEKQGEV